MKKIKHVYCVVTGSLKSDYKKHKFFEHKKDAIKNINDLFKKCYPSGFDPNIHKFVENPKYHDLDLHLIEFYTTANFYYSFVEYELN